MRMDARIAKLSASFHGVILVAATLALAACGSNHSGAQLSASAASLSFSGKDLYADLTGAGGLGGAAGQRRLSAFKALSIPAFVDLMAKSMPAGKVRIGGAVVEDLGTRFNESRGSLLALSATYASVGDLLTAEGVDPSKLTAAGLDVGLQQSAASLQHAAALDLTTSSERAVTRGTNPNGQLNSGSLGSLSRGSGESCHPQSPCLVGSSMLVGSVTSVSGGIPLDDDVATPPTESINNEGQLQQTRRDTAAGIAGSICYANSTRLNTKVCP